LPYQNRRKYSRHQEWRNEATELLLPAKPRLAIQFSYDHQDRLLDEVNLQLLAELQDSPRLSMAELARRVGMSAPAVTERVQRLERAGVIAGYRLDIDAAAVALPVTAFARIRPMPGSLPKIAELAAGLPQVTECYRITGEDCFLLKVHAPAIDQLEDILDRFLAYGNTTTSVVVSTPVPTRPPPLPAPSTDT
jgi:Lrp/AsnC family transcriptional regulator, leucine-responsive regulatory protein